MANGDIDGDLPATYKSRQTSFDQTNLPAQYQTAGPVARASQQLAGQQPSLTQVGGGAQPATSLPQPAAPVTPAPASLTQVGASSQQAVPANTSQPNIAQTAAPSFPGTTQQAGQVPSLFDAGANAVSLAQPMTSFAPSTPANGTSATQASPASPAPASAQSNQPQTAAPSLNGFQPTGIGADRLGGQIVGRLGDDGVPQFTNNPSAQQQAAGQPTLNGFGSGGNFSVGAPGDAARAMAGYQQLHDMRQQWANDDRLKVALAENARNNSLNVVHDSSRPLSTQDKQMDASLEQMRGNSLQNVQMAQNVYDDSVQRQGAQQQQRQAARLESLQAAAFAPGASAADRAAYQQAVDPTGEKALARQLTQAKIEQASAEASKTRADASGTSPAAQLTQLKLETAKQQQAQTQQDRQKAQAGQVATIDQALGSVDSLLGTKVDPNNPKGPRTDEDPGLSKAVGYASAFPTLPGTDAANFEARLDTLKAQTFLPQVALLKGQGALSDAEGKKLSDSVGALSPKMSQDAFRKSLGEIRDAFSQARARAAANGAAPSQGAAQVNSGPAQVSSEAAYAALPSGAEYLDPQGNHRRKS